MHGMLFAIITVLNSGGTYSPVTQANIQAALNAATCGDEVQIEAGTVTTLNASLLTWNNNGGVPCAPGNEMKLTTTKKAFLPDDNTRITPSYAPVIPILYVPTAVVSAGTPILDISRVRGQTTGIWVDGIGFQMDPLVIGGFFYASLMLNMGLDSVCDTVTNTASNLVANHILTLATSATVPGDVGGGITLSGTNVAFKNSWVNDARYAFSGNEVWGVRSRNGGSNQLIRNNYFGTALSEHVFMGAGSPYCQIGQAIPAGFTIEHNRFYDSPKWIPGTSTYLGALPTMKNFVECKNCTGVNVRWNTGDNLWTAGGAQYYPVTLTPRMSRDQSGCFAADSSCGGGCIVPHPLRASISGGGNTVTIVYNKAGVITPCTAAAGPDHCTYNFEPGWAVGGGISVQKVNNPGSVYTDWSMASIDSVTDQFHFTVTPALPTTADVGFGAGIYLNWDITNYFNRASNIFISGNFWKNVVQDGNYAALDTSCGGNSSIYHTTSDNVQYEHNLHVDDSPDFYVDSALSANPLSLNHWANQNNNGYAGFNLQVNHNTRYQTDRAALNFSPPLSQTPNAGGIFLDPSNRLVANGSMVFNGDNTGSWTGFDYSNNLTLPRQGTVIPSNWKNTMADLPTSRLFNNPDNGMYDFDFLWTCAPGDVGNRKCGMPSTFFGYPPSSTPGDPGNYEPKFINPAKNDWRVGLNSLYSKTATEGTDVGADTRNVAMIQNLTVTPTDVAVWFKFNVPGPLCGMPGQIEVSKAGADGGIHLVDDLGTYTVVNAVRPDYFIRSDSDQYNIRSTPAGCSRMMMIGDNISVNDDETAPVLRDLRLTPSTTYYYRLAVGGAMEKGSFTTSAAVTPPGSWSLKTATSTTHYKLRSGPNAANLVTGSTTPCGPGGCTVTLTPDANSRQLVYYILGCDSGGTVSNTWGPYFQMVR